MYKYLDAKSRKKKVVNYDKHLNMLVSSKELDSYKDVAIKLGYTSYQSFIRDVLNLYVSDFRNNDYIENEKRKKFMHLTDSK